MRKFIDEVVYPDAQLCEENGKRASKQVLEAMALATSYCVCARADPSGRTR